MIASALRWTTVPFCCLTLLMAAGCSGASRPVATDGGDTSDASSSSDANPTTKNAIGGPCTSGADCTSGACIAAFPGGGYCTQDCGAKACPGGSTCEAISTTQKVCLADCASVGDCRTGYACQQSVCVPSCRTNADCGAGDHCDTSSGQCLQGPAGCTSNAGCGAGQTCNVSTGQCVTPSSGNGAIGDACAQSSDCAAGTQATCLTAASGWPNGYCSSTCSQTTACPSGALCVSNGTNNFCTRLCSSQGNCGAGDICQALTGGSSSVCVPACQKDADCGSGSTCDVSTGQCVTGTTQPDGGTTDAGSTTVTTGQVTMTTVKNVGSGASINFDIPSSAVSTFFVAVESGTTGTDTVLLSTLADPSGTVLYQVDPNSGQATTGANSFELSPGQYSACGVQYPNAPPVVQSYTPGNGYSAAFLTQSGNPVDVTILTKTGPVTGGTLDVNIWFDNSSLTAAQAQNDQNFQAVVDETRQIWAKVGITLGAVTYRDLPDSGGRLRNIKAGTVGTLCSATASATNTAVNWVLVDSISSGGGSQGGSILGEAAGIPGTPLPGTSMNCVAGSMVDWQNGGGALELGMAMTHESSHWLGLFHTTESTGLTFDLLPDTPQCPVGTYDGTNREPLDGRVDDIECASVDGRYLMFWLVDSTGQHPHETISPQEAYVILRNPAIH